MMTLYGDGRGAVLEIGDTVSQSWRCTYKDEENGRCENPVVDGEVLCARCLKLQELMAGRENDK